MKLIESILFRDGSYTNLNLHQSRMDYAFKKYAPDILSHDLENILPIPSMEGTYKVRLVYDMDAENAAYDIEFAEYIPKKISCLQVVQSEPFDYSMKYENRKAINQLVSGSSADDIIIVINDNITDGSYFNLAFWDQEKWFTPDTPLLKGVRRTQLLNEHLIQETRITVSDLGSFEKVSLINAMLDLGELEVNVDQIVLL